MPRPADAALSLPTADPALEGIHVGISGWNYTQWRHGFYAHVPQRDWLAHCARRFTGMEVNATFFRFIRPEVTGSWRAVAPPGFLYGLKGHRFVTHVCRLEQVAPLLERMRQGTLPLGPRLGAVLWQVPSGLVRDLALLDEFARRLDAWPEARHVVEFRHHSWISDSVATLMAERRLAVCRSEGAEWPAWDVLTTDLAYLRIYGPVQGGPARDPRAWAEPVRQWRDQGRVVHVYFEADGNDDAPYQAEALIEQLRGTPLRR